jgi:dGTPase
MGGLDPDVAEAAALAHDLGHPPFGHVAEHELDSLVTGCKVLDGFEGNAQSFRIVNKIAVSETGVAGLNLTRATLNGILKYPWPRSSRDPKKFGAFATEHQELSFARDGYNDRVRSIEAEIMNWADDIAYSIHDVEDFYRASIVPLDRLITDDAERQRFLDGTKQRWQKDGRKEASEFNTYAVAFERALKIWRLYPPLRAPFDGTTSSRAALRSMTSFFVSQYLLEGVALDGRKGVVFNPDHVREMTVLKELIWHYVIKNPSLATQQHGQRVVIRGLFHTYHDAAVSKLQEWSILPRRFQQQLADAASAGGVDASAPRIVADLICSLTDREALLLHQRLSGTAIGSILERMPY